MATQVPQKLTGSDYQSVIGGSDFSGIVTNKSIFPIEIFVSDGDQPSSDLEGLIVQAGKVYPIKIDILEQLYARPVSPDFIGLIQLV